MHYINKTSTLQDNTELQLIAATELPLQSDSGVYLASKREIRRLRRCDGSICIFSVSGFPQVFNLIRFYLRLFTSLSFTSFLLYRSLRVFRKKLAAGLLYLCILFCSRQKRIYTTIDHQSSCLS